MQKIKLLFFIKTPPPITGATIINQQIVSSKKINNAFITKSMRLSYAKNASDIGKFNLLKPLLIIQYWFKLLFTLITFNPNYVYFQLSPFNAGFYRDLLYVFLIKLFRKKLIIHLHGKGIKQKSQKYSFLRILYKFVFKNSRIIHLSEKLAYDVRWVFKGNIYFLPNGIKEVGKITPKKSSNVIQLLFVSNLFKSKGVLILLEALVLLKNDGYDFKCTILGDDGDISLNWLQTYIKNLELFDAISLVGPKFDKDKYPYFSLADIFIHPTLSDCFPLVLLEAMSMKLPIIATNEGAITDMIKDGINGFIVEKNNPQQIAEKIEYLIEHPKLMKEMGQKGKVKFEREFTLEVFEKNTINIFNQILNE